MWSKVLSFFTGAPVEQIGEYFREKQQLTQELKLEKIRGRQEVIRAKYQAEAEKAKHVANWELASIANSGLKDEWVMLMISYPIIGSFIPYLQDNVLQGFKILAQTPYWFVGIVITIFLAVYGVRWKHASNIEPPKVKEEASGKV